MGFRLFYHTALPLSLLCPFSFCFFLLIFYFLPLFFNFRFSFSFPFLFSSYFLSLSLVLFYLCSIYYYYHYIFFLFFVVLFNSFFPLSIFIVFLNKTNKLIFNKLKHVGRSDTKTGIRQNLTVYLFNFYISQAWCFVYNNLCLLPLNLSAKTLDEPHSAQPVTALEF
jgi:hypothetical protein